MEVGILAARADIPRGFWMTLEDFGLEALIWYGMGRTGEGGLKDDQIVVIMDAREAGYVIKPTADGRLPLALHLCRSSAVRNTDIPQRSLY